MIHLILPGDQHTKPVSHLQQKLPQPTSIFPSSPKSPGSPLWSTEGDTCYKLRKGTPNEYVHKLLKCSMCDQAVNSKDELQTHHQEIHNIISCKECNKGFVTKESLRKHSYTHATGNNYKCILCKKFFTFPSELDAHMIKHDLLPNFQLQHCWVLTFLFQGRQS